MSARASCCSGALVLLALAPDQLGRRVVDGRPWDAGELQRRQVLAGEEGGESRRRVHHPESCVHGGRGGIGRPPFLSRPFWTIFPHFVEHLQLPCYIALVDVVEVR